MTDTASDPSLVACCGIYCGECRAYSKGRCPGCREHHKATWCKVRRCCRQQELATCADCGEFADPDECRKFNNIVSKLFWLLFKSDRAACIRQIRDCGIREHANEMSRQKRQTLRKTKRK